MSTQLILVREGAPILPYIFKTPVGHYYVRRGIGSVRWQLARYRHEHDLQPKILKQWSSSKDRAKMLGEALTLVLQDVARQEGSSP